MRNPLYQYILNCNVTLIEIELMNCRGRFVETVNMSVKARAVEVVWLTKLIEINVELVVLLNALMLE